MILKLSLDTGMIWTIFMKILMKYPEEKTQNIDCM